MAAFSSSDFDRQQSFRLKHEDDKFFTRLLSKETSKSNPSFRVYYGDVSSAVPFTWETIPGTPKHNSSQTSHIPPLTPPPSYYATNPNSSSRKYRSTSKLLLRSLLRRMSPTTPPKDKSSRVESSSSSSSSLSWSSSGHSSFSDQTAAPRKLRRRFASWGSSFDARSADEACCFGSGKESEGRVHHGGCSVLIVKKALLSIVGRGSA